MSATMASIRLHTKFADEAAEVPVKSRNEAIHAAVRELVAAGTFDFSGFPHSGLRHGQSRSAAAGRK